LIAPRARTKLKRNSFSIRVVKSLNRLPDNVKSAERVPAFEKWPQNLYSKWWAAELWLSTRLTRTSQSPAREGCTGIRHASGG
jgi:hypothetical protein